LQEKKGREGNKNLGHHPEGRTAGLFEALPRKGKEEKNWLIKSYVGFDHIMKDGHLREEGRRGRFPGADGEKGGTDFLEL